MQNKFFDFSQLKANFSKDFLASIVVFLVAIPLCLGIAIASGLPPTAGIITGIIGGIFVGSISGSPLAVSGPAAGLVVLVVEVIAKHGFVLFGAILMLAGMLQMLAGHFKLGVWFRAISPAVIHGMLAGIGILIIGSQFHIMLDRKPLANGIQNLMHIPSAVMESIAGQNGNINAGLIGLLTISAIVLWTKFSPKKLKLIPGALVGVLLAILVANVLHLQLKYITDLFASPADIGNLANAIHLPSMASFAGLMSASALISILSLAFVASAESLLSASAVDQMHSGVRTKYDKELFSQGLGNTVCGVLGVLPMTGVIVRSSANVAAGAVSRTSTIMHGFWLLLFISVFTFTLQYIPVAALAAVLVYTGFKLAYPKVLKELLSFGKAEVAIYVITILTIVGTSLLTGIMVGLTLSLIKLLYVFSHLDINVVKKQDDKTVKVHLTGSATIIGLPKLAGVLEGLALKKIVKIEFDDLHYIDHACIELLNGWQRQYVKTGGEVEIHWDNLHSKYHKR
ncbi:MAG: SulP family inorganic anion transporter [Methylotenera sp.]|nr:SulP family inorganic anion transporter [Methylotenera sp.]